LGGRECRDESNDALNAPLQPVAEGGGAGRGPDPCKEMPLPCKYLIEIIIKKIPSL
jgi:hypothetical protein